MPPRRLQELSSSEEMAVDFPLETSEAKLLLAEADSYLRHEWWFFGLQGLREDPINWHADPVSGKVAPAVFAFDINYRDPALVGDIKVTWEKNRHHHLTVLAVAYALTKDARYSNEVADQILGWVAKNPSLIGVNWSQPMEAGIRLIAWVWCERLLRGSKQHERAFGQASPVWESVYRHQKFIDQAYARGSSANNHLIGEMAGLFISSMAWPVFDESARWQVFSRKTLEREILRQTFPSGLNREMAFAYHIFTLEFFLLALLEAERAQARFSDEYRARTVRMLEVLPVLSDSGGNLPRYGDGDEGKAIQLQAVSGHRAAWLCQIGRNLLSANAPAPEEALLATAVLGIRKTAGAKWTSPEKSCALEDAGIYVLAANRGTPREVFVLADAGPHGYLSIAAHAHADALSFALSAGGTPFLVDPGTFVYHTDQKWRGYFRSTRAHNTVVIDDSDQSTQAGPFLWTHRARTTVQAWTVTGSGGKLVASHDGYAPMGVVHQRSLELDGQRLTILDNLQGSGVHRVTLCFHTAPECRVEKTTGSVLTISRGDVMLRLTLPEELQIELVQGAETAGWYSPRYGVKQETVSILAHWRGSVPVSFKTTMEVIREN
jgi:hypothetical protein